MIKFAVLSAAVLLLTPALFACGRASTNTAPTVATVYAGRVSLNDVNSVLGDANSWAPGAPTFGVRPLNSSSRLEEERFEVTVRFAHVGTVEQMRLQYQVWNSAAFATALMNAEQSSLGNSLSGAKAGDQSLYYNQNLQAGAAPYQSQALVRVGQTVINIAWVRTSSFANTADLAKVAARAVARLKDGLSGKVHASPTPASDPVLLAPRGPDLTLLGSDQLPISVVPQILYVANPDSVVALFHQLGATSFVYGDYALDVDTRMEVLTSGFTFLDPNGAKDWLNAYYGSNLSSGTYFKYESDTGQYVAAFGSGNRGVLMVCKSSTPGEEAARACEGPMARVADAWYAALANG